MQTMDDLQDAGVDILTLGQYLQPTPNHLPVERYVTPDKFDAYRREGLDKASSRSSPVRWSARAIAPTRSLQKKQRRHHRLRILHGRFAIRQTGLARSHSPSVDFASIAPRNEQHYHDSLSRCKVAKSAGFVRDWRGSIQPTPVSGDAEVRPTSDFDVEILAGFLRD